MNRLVYVSNLIFRKEKLTEKLRLQVLNVINTFVEMKLVKLADDCRKVVIANIVVLVKYTGAVESKLYEISVELLKCIGFVNSKNNEFGNTHTETESRGVCQI